MNDYFRQTVASHAVLNALMEVDIFLIQRGVQVLVRQLLQRNVSPASRLTVLLNDSPNQSIINEKTQLTVIVTTSQRARYRMVP